MGVTWLSEFVNFVSGWIFGEDNIWKYVFFNDIINLSQGILIFLVLVCKKTVYAKLSKRLRPNTSDLNPTVKLKSDSGSSKNENEIAGPSSNNNNNSTGICLSVISGHRVRDKAIVFHQSETD